MYQFPFAPDGTPNNGDVVKWNGTSKRAYWGAAPGALGIKPVQYVASDETNTVVTGDTNYHAVTGSAFTNNASDPAWSAPAAGCVVTRTAIPTTPIRGVIKMKASVEVGTDDVEVDMAVSVNGAGIGTPIATMLDGRGKIDVAGTAISAEICAELVADIVPTDTVQPIFGTSAGNLTITAFSMTIEPFS